MTKIIGLTGGIGSGKTTVAKIFAELGAPVYFADEAAKEIMKEPKIIEKIKDAIGQNVVRDGQIDRKFLSDIVFHDAGKLKILNEIVHPAVAADFEKWLEMHRERDFVIKEAAILFESGSYKMCDAIITVVAPEKERILRVVKRDNVSSKNVLARINNQWSDEKKIAKSDFIIHNEQLSDTYKQSLEIFKKIQNQ